MTLLMSVLISRVAATPPPGVNDPAIRPFPSTVPLGSSSRPSRPVFRSGWSFRFGKSDRGTSSREAGTGGGSGVLLVQEVAQRICTSTVASFGILCLRCCWIIGLLPHGDMT
jgi:hypothetical protein